MFLCEREMGAFPFKRKRNRRSTFGRMLGSPLCEGNRTLASAPENDTSPPLAASRGSPARDVWATFWNSLGPPLKANPLLPPEGAQVRHVSLAQGPGKSRCSFSGRLNNRLPQGCPPCLCPHFAKIRLPNLPMSS